MTDPIGLGIEGLKYIKNHAEFKKAENVIFDYLKEKGCEDRTILVRDTGIPWGKATDVLENSKNFCKALHPTKKDLWRIRKEFMNNSSP